MKVYETDKIRNIALVGHGDSGKTSIVSAMLFNTGVTNRLTKVDDGNTLSDYDPEEIKRKISLLTSICYVEKNKTKINLLDTPGYGNFFPESTGAIRVCDYTLYAICGVSGIEVQTEKAWKLAKARNKPGFFVINKLDRENSDYGSIVESLQNKFGREIVPIAFPIGKEGNFNGIVDLISEKAFIYEKDRSGKFKNGDIPEEMIAQITSAREELVEMVAESDESLMEKYLEEGTLTPEELASGLVKAINLRALFPVMPASAIENINIQHIENFITDTLSSPLGSIEKGLIENEEVEVKVSPEGKTSILVFKTTSDPHTGKANTFKVITGKLTAGMTLINTTNGDYEKMGTIFAQQGKDHSSVEEINAGDIAAAAKLKDTNTGQTLSEKDYPIKYNPILFPEPAISFSLESASKGDEEKIYAALKKIIEEDPLLKLQRNPRTGQLLVSGSGQLHVEVALSKMKERYKVEAKLNPPMVAYRETIKKKADVEAKHKKQSGGKGQYGHCKVKMEPLPRGGDFEFVDNIFGGSIPKTYIPAVEKGIQESRVKGFLAGYPVVDFKVTLYDGSYHDVDSSEMAFKIAGSLAFKKAMEQAKATLLEPIMQVEITTPDDLMGDVMGDLNSRRGKIQGMNADGENQVIKAFVPMAEMLTYESTLRSITGGRGYFSIDFSHYEEVPGQLQEKIIANAKHKLEEED